MYGRFVAANLPFTDALDSSVFVLTSDYFGVVDNKAFDKVQEAYQCCSDQLPSNNQVGSIWICNICDRIWATPSNFNSWTLTKLELVSSSEKDILAYQSYRWWLFMLLSLLSSFLIMFITFLITSYQTKYSVYLSFSALFLALAITGIIANKWRKLLLRYKLSICES